MVISLSDKEIRDVAHALLLFAKQTKDEQQMRVMDWIAHDMALEKFFLGSTHRQVKQKRCVLQKSKRARRERQRDSIENTVTAQQQDQSTQP